MMKAAPSKWVLYLGAFVGGWVGGYIPTLWGADFLSLSSVIGGAVGGIAGILLAYKLFGG